MTIKAKMIFVLLLFIMIFNSYSQPSLIASKTVNPATGEMNFSIPLVTVLGANGNDIPINLTGSSGITVTALFRWLYMSKLSMIKK